MREFAYAKWCAIGKRIFTRTVRANFKKYMSNTILILFLTLCLAGCGVNSNTQSVCKCCDNAFTSIEKALDCIELTQTKDRKQDNRLLLLAFVPYELDSVQALGWKIIPDKDIIRIAKQK